MAFFKVVKFKRINENKCWLAWDAVGTVTCWWSKCKIIRPSWKKSHFLKMLYVLLSYDVQNLVLGIYQRESIRPYKDLHSNVHSSFICNTLNLESIKNVHQQAMDGQFEVYLYNVIQLSNRREQLIHGKYGWISK